MPRPRQLLKLACLAAAVYGGTGVSRAQTTAANDAETQAVRAAAKDYLAALRRGDGARLRTMWTAEGDYVDAAGQKFKVQEIIARLPSAGAPVGESEPINLPQSTLRFVAPGVAVEDGVSGAAASASDGHLTSRFTAVWVKRDGRWLLDSLRESTVAAPLGISELKPLEWLVGEWAGSDGDAAIIMSWHWSDRGNYLIGQYLAYGAVGEAVAGTQRLGWDPASGQVKSWMLDDQGGSGEGRWRRDGNRWIAESEHTTADLTKAKSTATYSLGGDGKLTREVAFQWNGAPPSGADAQLSGKRIEFRRAATEE